MRTQTRKSSSGKSTRRTGLEWLNAPLPDLSKIPVELNRLEKFLLGQEQHCGRSRWNIFLGLYRGHQILASHRGEFAQFVARCDYSTSYAFQACRCVATWNDCPAEIRERIPITGLLVLSNSGCEEAIAEAKKIATEQRVTVAMANDLVAKHRCDEGRSNKSSVAKVQIPGLCTLVLHRVKGSDASSLSELLQAIEKLVEQFSSRNVEEVAA